MSAAGNIVVVWCWNNMRKNQWNAYEPQVCHHIETAYSHGGRSIQLGQYQSALKDYEIDFITCQQVSLSGTRRAPCPVQRKVVTSKHPLCIGYLWEFEGDSPGTFVSYDFDTMQHIDDHFKQLAILGNVLDLHPQPYRIDFGTMYQTRKNTGRMRIIQRRPMAHTYPPDNSAVAPFTGPFGGQSRRSNARPSPYAKSGASMITMSSFMGQVKSGNLAFMGAVASQSLQSMASGVSQSQLAFGLNSGSVLMRDNAGQLVYSSNPAVTETLPFETIFEITKTKKPKAKSAEEIIWGFVRPVLEDNLDTTDCPICQEKLSEDSTYGEGLRDASVVVSLSRCGHQLHKLCLIQMVKSTKSKDASVQCPNCKMMYGEKTGICPPGTMEWRIDPNLHLAGYESYGAIVVKYMIEPGKQTAEHPHPRKNFLARGFPRTGFIPDCDKGRKVLKLLIIAFQRRLMFTIGTSVTTGESDTVTWNEIHHKTEFKGNQHGHGYPDDKYLDNTLLELADHGVTEDCLEDRGGDSGGSNSPMEV